MRNGQMKTEVLEIDGELYEISELGMDTGFGLLGDEGELNIPAMIKATVTRNGEKLEGENPISLRVAQQLAPVVMKLNGMAPVEEGND